MPRFITAAVAALSLVALSTASAQDHFLQPTRQHEEMARDAGVWDADVTYWTAPDAEPGTSRGVETNEMLGKMWLMSSFEGEFGGQKFSGRQALGYDPQQKKYVGGWVDSMSPFMTKMSGDYDAATHTLTMLAEGVDAMTGKPSQMKMITRYESADAKTFEMHSGVQGQAGKWWKMMEIKYTRRKSVK